MTTREKVIEIIGRMSDAEIEAEYAHLVEATKPISDEEFEEILVGLDERSDPGSVSRWMRSPLSVRVGKSSPSAGFEARHRRQPARRDDDRPGARRRCGPSSPVVGGTITADEVMTAWRRIRRVPVTLHQLG